MLRPDQRPFRLKSGDELKALFQGALADADGVTGAHCIHERWMRGDFAAHIEADLELLWKSAGPSIPDWLPMRYVSWLPAAYEVAARFTAKGRGRTNVYLILLDYPGSTRRRPRRLCRHEPLLTRATVRPAQGGHPGRWVRAQARAWRCSRVPTLHLQNIPRSEAARIEAELARALGDAGIHTEGGH